MGEELTGLLRGGAPTPQSLSETGNVHSRSPKAGAALGRGLPQWRGARKTTSWQKGWGRDYTTGLCPERLLGNFSSRALQTVLSKVLSICFMR